MAESSQFATAITEDGLFRLRLDLAYDGGEFSGWAVQPGRRTVQGVLQQALATVLRVSDVHLVVAGRTDAGVHARGQVAHLDVPSGRWQDVGDRALRQLAGLLPADLRVSAIRPVPMEFDARFSALWRQYRYRISDANYGTDPLRRHDTVAWRRRLDTTGMREAARQMVGLNDFVAFCRRRDGATTIRNLRQLDVVRRDSVIEVTAQADAFCHSMVRSLVGALVAVGEGHRPAEWAVNLLNRTSRSNEVRVAPPHGLTLMAVGYPPDDRLAARVEQTRARRAECGPHGEVPASARTGGAHSGVTL